MKKLAVVLIMAMALIGCSKNSAGLSIDGQSQNVMFGDAVLGGRLLVDNIATKDAEGHARGIVTLTSQYTGDQYIQYRFYWYDDDGLEVNTKQAAWKQKIVRGFETLSISEVSINPNGKQFRVQIREANK
ncbi:YcfL family protein [Vibrio sp. TH_r3]|uniref:YcfL family protein n=1 Tax=Vibrio sp. TH_r3 TaxID=3082084 RepID=UPI002953C6CA|nr:YcfL family protein [Vibrio sp. TH_r3]MDV7103042.1 YcfL family protein [Vibrio sp. TH_r3]